MHGWRVGDSRASSARAKHGSGSGLVLAGRTALLGTRALASPHPAPSHRPRPPAHAFPAPTLAI